MSKFRSLRYRLPLLIAVPLGAGVIALAFVAHAFAVHALLEATRSRILGVSKQLAESFEASAQRIDRDLQRVAADSAIHQVLRTRDSMRDSMSLAAARARLTAERARGKDVPTYVLVASDRRAVLTEGPVLSEFDDRLPSLAEAAHVDTSAAGVVITPFLRSDSGLTYMAIAPVLGVARDTLGYVVAHRRLQAAQSSVNTLTTLFGASSTLLMGNASGLLWTNLVAPVPGPPAPIQPDALSDYAGTAGQRMLAVAVPIRGTPWMVAIQVPRAVALASAQGFGFKSAALAVVILAIGCVAALWLSRQVTDPLADVGRAAQAIAAGDYSSRIKLTGLDELGTLATLFNVMASRVQESANTMAAQNAALRDSELTMVEQNAALRESEVRYRQLVDRNPDAILVHRDHVVVLANPAATRLFGVLSTDALLGMPLTTLLPTVDPQQLETALDADSILSSWTESQVQRADGKTLLVEWASLALQLAGAPATLTILRDVTERGMLEQRLRQSQKMEAIGQLAGGVAHDFNNLLTVITSYSGVLLMEMEPDAPTRNEIQEIADAADRAGALTRQLLAFSRQQVLQPQIIDVNDIVRDMERMLSRLIPENIHLTTKLAPDIGHVNADPGQIEQVVMNLAVNARDAMPSGGQLTIASTQTTLTESDAALHAGAKTGTYVVLSVSDTGHGMSPAQQARIFEPFYTTKGPSHGTGLGLSTVYGIVRQSGGHVWVYSEVGLGTMFKVYLPQINRPSDRRTPAIVSAIGARRGETVLLAEDGPQVRAAARVILERSGYTVLEAATATEAVALLQSHPSPIHALLTDMVMPEMSGRDLALEFSAHRADGAIVFMSGYTSDNVLLQTVLEPGTQFLQKPFTPQSLLSTLRAALDRA